MNPVDHQEVDRLVARLSDVKNAEPPETFSRDALAATNPGLYAWWSDDEGLVDLSTPFEVRLPPLVYAGQAGATSTRSKTENDATLGSRIVGNHLRGNLRASTFRRTLTSVLFEPLGLVLLAPDRLDPDSNRRVTSWMSEHLRVVIAPVQDRATLAFLEHAVLERLDPPLNLKGMRATSTRTKLGQLRSAMKATKVEAVTAQPTPTAQPAQRPTKEHAMTLHEAMIEVLRPTDWLSIAEVADAIAVRGLYSKRDGTAAVADQIRLRATQSGGQYADRFEVDGGRIRLRSS